MMDASTSEKGVLRRVPIYPVLAGLYPVLYLWLANYSQVRPFVIERPLLLSTGLTVLLWLISLALLRRIDKAAAITGLGLVLFFSYGHIENLFKSILKANPVFPLAVCGLLFLAGMIALLRSKRSLGGLTLALNLIAGFMFLMVIAQLGYKSVMAHELDTAHAVHAASPQSVRADAPDVYYFLLDGYDRQDKLLEDVKLDNSDFTSQLQEMGFVFPECAQSNYNYTVYSMAASLNMAYLDQLDYQYENLSSMNQDEFTSMVQPVTRNNLVAQLFRGMGYKFITLKNIYPFVDYPDSDLVIDYWKSDKQVQPVEANNFQLMFMKTTLVRPLVDLSETSPEKLSSLPGGLLGLINPVLSWNQNTKQPSYNEGLYLQNRYQLDQLENVAKIPGKKFVYAHIMALHPPYTFTPTGGEATSFIETRQAYADQAEYVDGRMLTIVKNILAQSKTPPVIIIQSDHGHNWGGEDKQKFEILNAYYLPGDGSADLYNTITPVNTFRLILSHYFQQSYPLLPDQSILIQKDLPDGSLVVPPTCMESKTDTQVTGHTDQPLLQAR